MVTGCLRPEVCRKCYDLYFFLYGPKLINRTSWPMVGNHWARWNKQESIVCSELWCDLDKVTFTTLFNSVITSAGKAMFVLFINITGHSAYADGNITGNGRSRIVPYLSYWFEAVLFWDLLITYLKCPNHSCSGEMKSLMILVPFHIIPLCGKYIRIV